MGQNSMLTGARWHKSSHSAGNGGRCVETAPLHDLVGIRDSKNPEGPALVITSTQWRPFLRAARSTPAQGI